MILGITNNKFCSLRADFKQELFEQFQGKYCSIKTWKWFSDTNEIMIYVFHINTDDNEYGWFPPSDNSGKIYVNATGGQVVLKIRNLHMTKQNASCGSLTSMLAML
jgi:hypothetical protein